MRIKPWLTILKETFSHWSDDRAPRMGAALAFYSAFSIAPLLIIAIAIAGLIFGQQAARAGIVSEIRITVGATVASAVDHILIQVNDPNRSFIATIIGACVLLFAAGGVFSELQDSLNTVWHVEPKPGRAIWQIVRERFFSFTMVLGTGFLMLVSLVVSALLSSVQTVLVGDAQATAVAWRIVHVLISFGVVTLLFALIFKYVPDAKIAWRDVWVGAVLTAALFTLGKFLLGWYLGQESTTSAYGAAGSLVVILLWVYYAAQILLFGAEFTRVFSTQFHATEPKSNAVPARIHPLSPRAPLAG